MWKRFYTDPKTVLLDTKRVLPGTNKGSSKGSPIGTAEEPFKVLDSTLFFLRVYGMIGRERRTA